MDTPGRTVAGDSRISVKPHPAHTHAQIPVQLTIGIAVGNMRYYDVHGFTDCCLTWTKDDLVYFLSVHEARNKNQNISC